MNVNVVLRTLIDGRGANYEQGSGHKETQGQAFPFPLLERHGTAGYPLASTTGP